MKQNAPINKITKGLSSNFDNYIERINSLPFPLKSSEILRSFKDFKKSRSWLIRFIFEANFGDDPLTKLALR